MCSPKKSEAHPPRFSHTGHYLRNQPLIAATNPLSMGFPLMGFKPTVFLTIRLLRFVDVRFGT